MKRVLIIQTGGTISMKPDPGNPEHIKGDAVAAAKLLTAQIPELQILASIDIAELFFMDSSNLGPFHWVKLTETIRKYYSKYDGFVVLHGTDTMAYSASALSFSLQGLGKPVVFTGSQVPLATLRSDARRNLINSVEIATMPIPEVGICFNDRLYRANRSSKMSIGDFDAFNSPNCPPLAEIGLHIKTGKVLPVGTGDFNDDYGYDTNVYVLKVFPGLQTDRVQQLAGNGLKCLVIEAFGSGNFPVTGSDSLLPFFEQCIQSGILLVMTSQAPYDAVDMNKYEAGRAARDLGIISAGDMTLEASLTKMMYLLNRSSDPVFIRNEFTRSLAGEITT